MTSMTGQGPLQGPTGKAGNKIPKGYEMSQYDQYTPEQHDLQRQGFQSVGPDSFLSKLAGGDQSLFGQLEAPALQQHSSQQGNLASRFSGMGMSGRHSSGFQNEATSASSNFAQQLQSQRMGLQRNAITDLHAMSQQLLGNRPYETQLNQKPPKKENFFKSAAKFFSPIYADIDEGGFENTGNFLKTAASFL